MAKPWELHTVRELTRLFPTAIADDVEGWGSAGGGPGEAGSMVLRVGLTVFLIHDAIVELWLFTESMRSPTRFQFKQTNKQSEVVYLQWSWFHDWLTQLFASWFFLHAIMCKIAFTHSWLLYRQAILLEVRSILQTLNTHRRNSVSIPELLLHTHRIKESSGWTLLLLFV